jgi:hypothetical protein
MFWSRAGTDERTKSEKGNRGDGENKCSSRTRRQQAGATRDNAHEEREGQPRRRGEQMFESHEGGSKQERRGTTRTRRVKRRRASRSAARARPARPMGGALNPRTAKAGAKRAHGASAGVASSLQCRYYDQ